MEPKPPPQVRRHPASQHITRSRAWPTRTLGHSECPELAQRVSHAGLYLSRRQHRSRSGISTKTKSGTCDPLCRRSHQRNPFQLAWGRTPLSSNADLSHYPRPIGAASRVHFPCAFKRGPLGLPAALRSRGDADSCLGDKAKDPLRHDLSTVALTLEAKSVRGRR